MLSARVLIAVGWLGGCLMLAASTVLLAGCDVAAEPASIELGSEVQLLSGTRGELAEGAARRLLPYGRAALPYLEAALHRAPPVGRHNIAMALGRLGLPESASLLGQIAAFDGDRATARLAWRTLSLWASEREGHGRRSGPPGRAEAAAAALRKVDEVRGMDALLLDAE